MLGLFEDEGCLLANGQFKYFHPNGILSSFGKFKHGKKEGMWLNFHNNQMMSDSIIFSNGNPLGTSLSWHENGIPSDSLVIDENGVGVEVTFTNEGVPSSAGRYGFGKRKEGKWTFFHSNGNRSAIEIYHENNLLDKQYFNESGILMNDTTNNDRKADFPGGNALWQQWLYKKIYFPSNLKLVNTDSVVVVIKFTINEKGAIENAFVSTPFEGDFNKIALNAIQKSPMWIPARMHNRTIPYPFRQTIHFAQVQQ